MNLIITGKQYQRNYENQSNIIYFNLDGNDLEIAMVYINQENYFIGDKRYIELEDFIKNHYDCDFEDFKNYFRYRLYRYSRQRNLKPMPESNLSYIKYKE